jgi:RNA-directed DNA polymerase
MRRQVRAWLKAGVMDGKELFPTSEGTQQGGVISPLLANIALHGMEKRIKQIAETLPGNKRDNRKSLSLIRYADDFVILHEDVTVVQRCQQVIAEWLKGIGLELKPSKTRLVHTLNKHEGQEPGFNFLGYNVKQYPVGKYATGCNSSGKPLGFKTLIKPSDEAVKVHYVKLAEIIDQHKAAPQAALITRLNPVIRGWSNYYSTAVSQEKFSETDHKVYLKLKRWAQRRHPNKSGHWMKDKYWQTIGGDNWVFATNEGKAHQLLKHSATEIKRHMKVKGEASPFDGNLVYWSTRMENHPEMPKQKSTLLKRQKGKCTHGGLDFTESSVMEVDHVIPKSKGGKDTYNNLQLVHRHCHDEKTARDGSRGTRDKSLTTEEPDEMKVSRPVLKTSENREKLA